MSTPDPVATAALRSEVIKPVWFAFLDILGDPVRANTSGADVVPSGTGDPDLDGQTFVGITGDLVTVSPVKYAPGGSQTVTASLSGIPGLDNDLIAQLDNVTNWRGRNARLWRVIRNAANVQQGGFQNYYTGKIVGLSHTASGESQTIEVTIESYLAVFSQASNRTYMDQTRFDAGDNSAAAAVAIANGNYTGAPGGGSYADGRMGGVGGAFGDNQWVHMK